MLTPAQRLMNHQNAGTVTTAMRPGTRRCCPGATMGFGHTLVWKMKTVKEAAAPVTSVYGGGRRADGAALRERGPGRRRPRSGQRAARLAPRAGRRLRRRARRRGATAARQGAARRGGARAAQQPRHADRGRARPPALHGVRRQGAPPRPAAAPALCGPAQPHLARSGARWGRAPGAEVGWHVAAHVRRRSPNACAALRAQVCANCGTSDTTLWRKNREHTQDLCNACGCYLATNKVNRPAHLFLKDRNAAGGLKHPRPPAAAPAPAPAADYTSDESSDDASAELAPAARAARCALTAPLRMAPPAGAGHCAGVRIRASLPALAHPGGQQLRMLVAGATDQTRAVLHARALHV